jgi:hypothetical protein
MITSKKLCGVPERIPYIKTYKRTTERERI